MILVNLELGIFDFVVGDRRWNFDIFKIIFFSCPGAYFNLVESIRGALSEPAEATAEGNQMDDADTDPPVPPCGTNEEPFDLTAEQIIGKA